MASCQKEYMRFMISRLLPALSAVGLSALLAFSLTTCSDDANPVVSNSPSGPQLTMPESTFVFGFAPQSSMVSHVFWLHSTGGDTLRILQIDPG